MKDKGYTKDVFVDALNKDIKEIASKRDYREIEAFAEKMVNRVMPGGYDLEEKVNPEAELRMMGAWEPLEKEWKKVCSRFLDKENLYGPSGARGDECRRLKLKVFREATEKVYSPQAVEKFLEAYGLSGRIIKRSPNKKFERDGSYTVNVPGKGEVRFGR